MSWFWLWFLKATTSQLISTSFVQIFPPYFNFHNLPLKEPHSPNHPLKEPHSQPAVSSYKSAVLELLAHNDLLQKIFGQRYAGLIDLMQRTSTEITITQTDELGKKATQDRHVIIEGMLCPLHSSLVHTQVPITAIIEGMLCPSSLN